MKSGKNRRVARAVAYAIGNSTAIGCTVLMSTGSVHAQNQPAEATTEEIVVTGIRGSLQSSIADKRESEQIVETISAEDIGKLPDNSIAESLSRAPGLTTQRLQGRAQVISIRGLAPDFSTTLLNGREQVTTGDNRSAEYDQYPAELLSSVVVYKTPQAALIGQGLSGTVDLRTMRPLERGDRVIAANVRGETLSLGDLNAGSEDTGYRGSASYVDQFAGDTIGIAVGIAHMTSPTQIEQFNSWGYPETTPGGPRVIGGAKPYVISTELERTGVMATLQFQPTDNFTTALDAYYSKFEDDQLLRGVEFPLWWGGAALDAGDVENNIISQGSFANVKGVVRNDANRREADLYSLGWNAQFETGAWTLVGDVSWSSVEREDIILETYAGTGRAGSGAVDTLGFSFGEPGEMRLSSNLDYADPNQIFLTSPQGWGGNYIAGGQDGFLNNPSTEDDLNAFRVSASRELDGFFRGIDFGANYTLRDKTYRPDRYYLGLAANLADPEHDLNVPIPQSALMRPTRLGFLGIDGMVSYDPIAVAYSGLYNFVPAADADVYARNWDVEEDVLTSFAMVNMDADLGWANLTGNVGLQFVQTDQTSSGIEAINPPAGAPVGTPATTRDLVVSQDYTETLPSLNASLRFPNDFIVRLGAARQLARPRLDEMKASTNFAYEPGRAGETDVNNSPRTGNGGNPLLRPWIADAVDLSVEKYFAREGYVSGALFYKDLKSYIYQRPEVFDFTGFEVPSGPEPVLREGIVSRPQNASGGEIYGYEVAVAVPFGMFAEPLDGFGVITSYSLTKSNIQPDPSQPGRPIPGLSEDVVNGTLYYEKGGFSVRGSVRYRSEFLAEVQGVGADRLLRMSQDETLVDAQISYEFQSGVLERVTLLLQGTNLTDEPFITNEIFDDRQVIDHQTFGRRYLFGVSYKY